MGYLPYCRLRVPTTASNRAVVRAVHRVLNEKGRSRGFRAARHRWLRVMLDEHRAARALAGEFRL